MNDADMKRPLVFGEVLYDCFPDGSDVLGGAPFNVAWHLQGLGLKPMMISGVGRDARGAAIINTMAEWGMDTRAMQRHETYPTGQVTVSLQDGQPAYDIVADQAYDHIAPVSQDVLNPERLALIYHGSLALRNETSRNTLNALIESTDLPVFLDLNLRAPWWRHEQLMPLLQRATWVKLNDEELCDVTGVCSSGDTPDIGNLYDAAKQLFDQCALEWLIVTRGEQGAFVIHPGGLLEGEPVTVNTLADTVGAGDAFSAVCINGIIRGWTLEKILAQALGFAARVCEQHGATAQDRSLYGLLAVSSG
ncbi:MAG: carbohydrate kinase [Gammaproteobacteria bacterium]|nr:carbohydrate kinase [Gammaproteobacteria bacterium]